MHNNLYIMTRPTHNTRTADQYLMPYVMASVNGVWSRQNVAA